MSIYDSEEWTKGDLEDKEEQNRMENENDEGFWEDENSQRLLAKEDIDEEEDHNLKAMRDKKYLTIGLERKGAGPERKNATPSSGSVHATLYADDTSALENAKTIRNLENKTEVMLGSRLAVNTKLCALPQHREEDA